MGAKVIPHLMAKLGASDPAGQTELMMIPYDGLPGPALNEPFATPEYIFDAARGPRESQGPAKLLLSDQMESLLGWYV